MGRACVSDEPGLSVGGPGGTPRAVLASRLERAAVLRGGLPPGPLPAAGCPARSAGAGLHLPAGFLTRP